MSVSIHDTQSKLCHRYLNDLSIRVILDPRLFSCLLLTQCLTLLICFVEAEMAQNRILELKEQEYNMQYQALVFSHQQRQEEIQAAHIKQY